MAMKKFTKLLLITLLTFISHASFAIDFKIPGGIKGTIKSGKTLNLKVKKDGKYTFSIKIQNPVRQRPGAEAWSKYDVSYLLEELEIKVFDSKNKEIINNDYVRPKSIGRYSPENRVDYKPPKRVTQFAVNLIATESYRLVFKPMVNLLKKEKYFLIAKFKAPPTRYHGLELEEWGAIVGIFIVFGIVIFFWKVSHYAHPLAMEQAQKQANAMLKEQGIEVADEPQEDPEQAEEEVSESETKAEDTELFCPKCGTKREEDGAFCGDCGYRFK
jgi:hypothetical protein